MKYGFLLISLLCLIACDSQNNVSNQRGTNSASNVPLYRGIDTIQLGLNFTPQGNYQSLLKEISTSVAKGNHSAQDLEDYLLNRIIPHWYGTPWDFNGYTNIPNQGVIACGYFVSTTLKHVGFNLNRYHLAQQAGLNEAKSLALSNPENYETIYGKDNLKNALDDRYVNGLYFVGLDNHVGFLYIKDKVYYFIHSNYIDNKVMLEKAMSAEAFQSNIYVVAKISTNEDLLQYWREGKEIPIIKG